MPLQIDETGCYKGENCRQHSERQEKIDFNQKLNDTLPIVNNLAIQKDSVLLTRKFALIPDFHNLIDRKRTYSAMTDMFAKITSLKNVYIKGLIEHAKSGGFDDFKGSSKVHARRVYDALSLTKFDGLPFLKSGNKQFKLKERVKQCANFEVYIIVRNWLIRNENLKVILDYLISKFENDEEFALTFLAGKRFSSKQIHEIQNALEKNCFGQRQNLSTFYLNNHIYQIRNLFFKTFDFPSSLLYNPQNKIQSLISEILLNMSNSSSFIKYIANNFTRKKNNYEQRLLQRGIANFRSKLKWNKIKRELSLCWNRLSNINSQIVGLVNHFTIHIANLHNISKVKVEDLRFSKHSKKRDSGKFMTFWQIHWFFSQVQDAIRLQCQLNGIKFQKVPARGTSQRCSRCGKLGDREGKVFHCNNCGLTLDSDLNAARNVVIYEPSINQTVEYQVHFNDPIW